MLRMEGNMDTTVWLYYKIYYAHMNSIINY